jgi:hypothetical protein
MKLVIAILLTTLSFTAAAGSMVYGFQIDTHGVKYGEGSDKQIYKYNIVFDNASCETHTTGTHIYKGAVRQMMLLGSCDWYIDMGFKIKYVEFTGNNNGVYIGSLNLMKAEHIGSNTTSHARLVKAMPHNRWVDKNEDDRQLVRRIYAKTERYDIRINTGVRKGAGTDSDIRLDIIAEDESKSLYSYQPDNKNDNFEKGASEVFSLYHHDFGKIVKICVSSNGEGDYSDWYAEKLILTKVSSNQTSVYDIESWFNGTKECFTLND